MLLGIAIERLKGCKLADLELPPGLTWHPDPAETVATERCTWRGRVMRGEVHDENAFALGGAAGHAGLFGTIDGVLDAAQRLLQGTDPWLPELRTRQTATRCLGWEARHEGWSGGNACSEETIGHTGFTGTGLWIDFRAWTGLDAADQPRASDAPSGHRHRHAAPQGRRSDRRSGVLTVGRWSRCAAITWLLLVTSAASFAASMDDLLRAYPDALAGFDGADLIWRDGTRMPVDDGLPDKSMEEQLRHGSILDQLRLPYPAGGTLLPAPRQDPGRVRNTSVLR